MDEIETPNKEKRNRIISKYKNLHANAKSQAEKDEYLTRVQEEIVANDLANTTDDASLMVNSGALGGKRMQLVKMRSSPVVLKDHKGNLVQEIVGKSYAEGVNVLDYWNGAAEARANLIQGQVQTSEPGVVNKVTNNLMGDMVISMEDCNTRQGILLNTKDENVLDRYLATSVAGYRRNTLVTPDVQQALLKANIKQILVRSPQTCSAMDNTVCQKCMGLSMAHSKPFDIGDNVGAISAGALSEVSTQLVLSAKHSTTMAEKTKGLRGIKGLNTLVEMPKIYPDKQVVNELYGKVYKIFPAPQGGKFVWIMETRKVPERYLVDAQVVPNMAKMWQYYIPPNRKLEDNIEKGVEVHPGQPLTDGNINLKTMARLRGLGLARMAASEGISQVYKNTGHSLDRRHFELLSRAMLNYVKIEKAPPNFPLARGEVVQYNKLRDLADQIQSRPVPLKDALGMVLAEEVGQLTIGTEITPIVLRELEKSNVKRIKVTTGLEVSPVVTPMSRVQNNSTDSWISKLNHRYIKSTLTDAATTGQSQDVKGFSPVAAYAYGVELGNDKRGRY